MCASSFQVFPDSHPVHVFTSYHYDYNTTVHKPGEGSNIIIHTAVYGVRGTMIAGEYIPSYTCACLLT